MTNNQIRFNQMIDDMVLIARGKPCKPAAEQWPFDNGSKWHDVTTDEDRRKIAEFKRQDKRNSK